MRTPGTRLEDSVVWHEALQSVLAAYRLSRIFFRFETYDLSSQLRRATVSIASSIAEKVKKRGKTEKLRYYSTISFSPRILSTAMFRVKSVA